jgi:hypothetical protein
VTPTRHLLHHLCWASTSSNWLMCHESHPFEQLQAQHVLAKNLAATTDTIVPAGSRAVDLAIEFSGRDTSAGLRFHEEFAVTCQQRNRARAWMPCVDSSTCRATWDIKVRAVASHIVVACGDLVTSSASAASRPPMRIWHYRVGAATPPCSVVVAVGAWQVFVAEGLPTEVRTAVAESLEPAEDASAVDTAMPTGAEPAVTGFSRRTLEARGLLEETCGGVRLVQCILEQWLLCSVPWPMYSLVFVPSEVCQVRARTRLWRACGG